MATSTTPQPYTADRPENSTTSVDASVGLPLYRSLARWMFSRSALISSRRKRVNVVAALVQAKPESGQQDVLHPGMKCRGHLTEQHAGGLGIQLHRQTPGAGIGIHLRAHSLCVSTQTPALAERMDRHAVHPRKSDQDRLDACLCLPIALYLAEAVFGVRR
jgi:hypothetical protein